MIGLASSNRKPHIGRVNSQQALPCRHIHVLFEIWSSQHVCRNFVVSPLKRSFPVCCDKYVHEHFIPSFHSLHSLLSFHSRTFHFVHEHFIQLLINDKGGVFKAPVQTYPYICESATFSFRLPLPSTRFRRTDPQVSFKSVPQSRNF